jgi:DNA (cytosine-5)-methyltransferase 1
MSRERSGSIKFVDAFAGCGGLSLGLLQAGMRGEFAIEHDKFAFETLQSNLLQENSRYRFSWPRWLPKAPISVEDLIQRYTGRLDEMYGKIDVLAGGPPCQGFSSAGRRRLCDPRNRLFETYVRLVEVLRPRVVLIENVRGFTINFSNSGNVNNYAKMLRSLLCERYQVYEEMLDLSLFGVPQLRKRYFLIAFRSDLCSANPFGALMARLSSFLRSLGLRAPVSSWSAISDLEVSRGGVQPSRDTAGFNEILYTSPLTSYQKLMAAESSGPSDLRLARHSDEIAKRFAQIIDLSHAEGRLNTSISEDVRARFGLKKRALRVLDPDRPSPTITSMPDDLLHYCEPRTLTVRETARLQGFPDWFAFKGKYTTGGDRRRREVPRFTQVANAVPPLVARAIGEMLIDVLCADATSEKAKDRLSAAAENRMKASELLPKLEQATA